MDIRSGCSRHCDPPSLFRLRSSSFGGQVELRRARPALRHSVIASDLSPPTRSRSEWRGGVGGGGTAVRDRDSAAPHPARIRFAHPSHPPRHSLREREEGEERARKRLTYSIVKQPAFALRATARQADSAVGARQIAPCSLRPQGMPVFFLSHPLKEGVRNTGRKAAPAAPVCLSHPGNPYADAWHTAVVQPIA